MSVPVLMLVLIATTCAAAVFLSSVYRALIARADVRTEDSDIPPMQRFVTPVALVRIRFVWAGGVAISAILYLVARGVFQFQVVLATGLAGVIVGYMAPLFWFRRKVRARKAAFDAQILHLTMTLANGLRSGMALPQALDAAARRMPPPMQEELAVVLRECRLGLDLAESMERLYRRMPGEDLRLLLTSIRLTMQAGGSLADVLDRMVTMIRARTEFQEKLKTMTAQGRFEAIAMSVAPLVVFLLLKVIDPELMAPMTTTVVGWVTLVAVAVWVGIGFVVIRKISSIEV